MLLRPEACRAVTVISKAIPSIREERKLFALILDVVSSLWECTRGSIFLYKRRTAQLHTVKSLAQRGEAWDPSTVAQFFRNERPALGANMIMAPVRVGQDVVGVLALSKDGPFEPGAGKVATEILKIVGGMLRLRRQIDILEAEGSIASAILRGIAPKDIVYRAFHAFGRFVDCDHGMTLVAGLSDTEGKVIARRVAWRPGKSEIVGKVFPIAWHRIQPGSLSILDAATAPEVWKPLWGLLEAGSPPKKSMLVAMLAGGGGLLGCVEVSSQVPGFFKGSDAGILCGFLPFIASSLERMEEGM